MDRRMLFACMLFAIAILATFPIVAARAQTLGREVCKYPLPAEFYADKVGFVAACQHYADLGYAPAETTLGDMYSTGSGVSLDKTMSEQWYRRAAVQGYAPAQYTLGLIYDEKYTSQKLRDNKEAISFFTKAAEQNYAPAQSALGDIYSCYFYRSNCSKNIEFALMYYKKAANQRYSRAQERLGVIYYDGDGVPVDLVKAYMWFSLAAAEVDITGNDVEKFDNTASKWRDLVEKRMTPDQIAQALKMVSEWKPE